MKNDLSNIDEKIKNLSKNKRRSAFYFLLLPLGMVLFAFYFFTDKILEANDNLTEIQRKVALTKDTLNMLHKNIKEITETKDSVTARLWGVSDSVFDGSNQKKMLRQSQSADSLLQNIVDLLDSNELKKIKIQYYRRNADEGRIWSALQEYGFEMREHPARHELENKPVNFIAFGNSVKKENVKLVALALLRAGVPLKQITELKSSAGRENTIQIGYNSKAENQELINAKSVINSFSR